MNSSTDRIERHILLRIVAVLCAGLVRNVKAGRERLWEFEPDQLEEARRSLEAIGRKWDQALMKLKQHVER